MIEFSDLKEFEGALMIGVTVGVGSQVISFENGSSILIQCPFRCRFKNYEKNGHGEISSTSSILFDFLNQKVKGISLEKESVLTLNFGELNSISIIPDRNGLESYVITTRLGICPVLLS